MGIMNTTRKKVKSVLLILGICLILTVVLVVIYFKNNKHCNNYVEISTAVQQVLDDEGLFDCHIKSIGDYSRISVKIKTPVISEEELNEYIEEISKINIIDQQREEYEYELLEQKKIEALIDARNSVKMQLFNLTEFCLNENAVLSYSERIVDSYETEAYIYGLELDEYVEKRLGKNFDEFFEDCYSEGEEFVKTYLIMGAIYKKEFLDEELEGENIYLNYQEIMNKVYSLFIHVDDNF